jgi:hypothetical protein
MNETRKEFLGILGWFSVQHVDLEWVAKIKYFSRKGDLGQRMS